MKHSARRSYAGNRQHADRLRKRRCRQGTYITAFVVVVFHFKALRKYPVGNSLLFVCPKLRAAQYVLDAVFDLEGEELDEVFVTGPGEHLRECPLSVSSLSCVVVPMRVFLRSEEMERGLGMCAWIWQCCRGHAIRLQPLVLVHMLVIGEVVDYRIFRYEKKSCTSMNTSRDPLKSDLKCAYLRDSTIPCRRAYLPIP